MDGGGITETVDNLQKLAHTEDVANFVGGISNSLFLAEYEEAAALFESLLQGKKQ